MPYVDFQSFFSVFTQISPVDDTFGWNIFVANQPVGHVNTMYNEKSPFETNILEEQRGTLL